VVAAFAVVAMVGGLAHLLDAVIGLPATVLIPAPMAPKA
jgi:hypothetical protein